MVRKETRRAYSERRNEAQRKVDQERLDDRGKRCAASEMKALYGKMSSKGVTRVDDSPMPGRFSRRARSKSAAVWKGRGGRAGTSEEGGPSHCLTRDIFRGDTSARRGKAVPLTKRRARRQSMEGQTLLPRNLLCCKLQGLRVLHEGNARGGFGFVQGAEDTSEGRARSCQQEKNRKGKKADRHGRGRPDTRRKKRFVTWTNASIEDVRGSKRREKSS